MKFFIEKASNEKLSFQDEVPVLIKDGIIHGITLNTRDDSLDSITETVCKTNVVCKYTYHVEMLRDEINTNFPEAIAAISRYAVISLPATWANLSVCSYLRQNGVTFGVFGCCSSNQAILAARAGASYISLPIGRLYDMNYDGMELLQEIRTVCDSYEDLSPYIVVSSIRSPQHIQLSSMLGADIASVPLHIFKTLMSNPLADQMMGDCFVESYNGK